MPSRWLSATGTCWGTVPQQRGHCSGCDFESEKKKEKKKSRPLELAQKLFHLREHFSVLNQQRLKLLTGRPLCRLDSIMQTQLIRLQSSAWTSYWTLECFTLIKKLSVINYISKSLQGVTHLHRAVAVLPLEVSKDRMEGVCSNLR